MPRRHFESNHQLSSGRVGGEAITVNTRNVVAANIQYYREKQGMTQTALAKKLGITSKAVSNWEHGITRPDVEHIPAICLLLKTVPTRLFGMSGDTGPSQEKLLCQLRTLGKLEREAVLALTNTLYQAQEMRAHPCPKIRRLPVAVKAAAASIGDSSDYYYEDPDAKDMYVYECDEALMADCLFTVRGDSMEPSYYDGEQVFVKETTELVPGQIGIFSIANEIYIKEYQKDGLHSHNPKYKTIVFSPHESIVSIGVVLAKVERKDIPTEQEIERYCEIENENER